VFDKTGTLTKAIFKVSRVVPEAGFGHEELLQLVSATETHSNHPIAQSIREAAPGSIDISISDFEEMPGYGVSARVNGKHILSGSDKMLHRDNIPHAVCDVGGTGVHAVVDGRYAGYICISDEVRDDARIAISRLKGLGINSTVMLTGDKHDVAARTAHDLGIDSFRAELLPEDKVTAIEELESHQPRGKLIAFVGDGINDAPVIARANVGIAMGGLGSDAAIESADVVMMTDNLNSIAEAIQISRKTRAIVWQNISFALGVKGIFIVLGAIGVADLWEAVFADVGVALLAILNATRAMR
jgi:Cd2+/Zn2+-exporting ATPase